RSHEGIAGFAGLQTCGSVWACPCCGGKILTHRALEIGAVLGQAVTEGRALGFFTLTMRHRKAQPLDLLWAAGQKGWRRAISGKGWVSQSGAHGVEGWVRVWEVTDGSNGWHVHVHGVVVLRPGAKSADLDDVCSGMFDRWRRGLLAAGLDAPLERGQEWHLVRGDDACDDLAGYLFKIAEGEVPPAVGLGLELTHSLPGRSRAALATRPVSAILDDLVRDGERRSLDRWHEWERVSKGKRQVGFSKGLRERFAGFVDELSDDEVADLEHGSREDDLVHLDRDGWRQVVGTDGLAVSILEAAEKSGVAGVSALLDQEHVPYQLARRR
ncbi:MAG: hypothetical protein WCB04_08130, partial [Mycobacteriales bacterium]